MRSGATPGQQVEVWFTGGGEESDHFTYTLASDTGRRVLLLVGEDYTGNSGFLPRALTPYFETTYASSAVVPRLEQLYREVLAAR